MWDRISKQMSRPVSGASLAFFRIAFGAVMFYEGLYYLGLTWNNPSTSNYIDSFYTGKHIVWNVHYPGFSWIKPLPEPLMTVLFVAFALAGLLVALGVLYRLAIIGVFLSFTYINLMDAWTYLNHHYLACMFALLLSFMPADRRFSLRSLIASASGRNRHGTGGEVPFWTVFVLRAQLFIVYFYAGVAKINPDWLAGEPLRMWFRQPNTVRHLEPWIPSSIMQAIRTFLAQENTIWAFTYGGMIFDLAIGFLLVFRRTRILGFFLVLGFHTFNHFHFTIGAFPIMAVCLTMIFFEPDWPERVWRWICNPTFARPNWRWLIGGMLVLPPLGAVLGWKFATTPASNNRRMRLAPWTMTLVVSWLAFQAVVPLRHFFIEGPSNWTEEGTMFSWHMMLRTKMLGNCLIEIVDPELPVVDSDVGPYADWRLPKDQDPVVPYRQVKSGEVPWAELPEFVIISEPIVGERIIYNPLSNEAQEGDPVGTIRNHWSRVYGYEAKLLHETHSVAKLLDVHEDYVRRNVGNSPQDHVIVQIRGIEVARQIDQHRRDLKYTEVRRLEFSRRLFESLAPLVKNPSFGNHLQTLFYYKSAPLDGLGDDTRDTPFFVVLDPKLFKAGPGTLPVVRRELWQGSTSTLVDLWTYSHNHLAHLPRCLSFHDLDGQPALIWNYTHEMHLYQSIFVTVMPTFLHRYVQHVASDWEERYGRRPQVYVTNYVKLNHHPMQLIIDPTVDMASVPLTIFRHNPWMMPLKLSIDSAGVSRVAPTP